MQHDNCSNSSLLNDALPIYKASSAVLGLCFVLGVPGNLSVLWILVPCLKKSSFSFRMMLSLAVSDLLTLLPMPLWIWALLHDWDFGIAACKIVSYIEYWCLYSSMLCVTLMSFQRYMQVLHPQKWAKLGVNGKYGLLCGTWILSGVLSLYAPVQREVGCDQYGFQYCYQHFKSTTEEVATSLFEIFLFSTCFSLMVYFYYCLYRGVNQSRFFSSNRMTTLVTRVVVVFFIFGVPVAISNILIVTAVLLKNDPLTEVAGLGGKIATTLIFLNSSVNPFLYTFSLKQLSRHNTVAVNLGQGL